MAQAKRYKTVIRMGASHHSATITERGNATPVRLPLQEASDRTLHALAGTLCQLHGIRGKGARRDAR